MARSSTVGERVRAARLIAGLSARGLDAKAGLTPGHTWLIENRDHADVTSDTARALSRALGVSLDWLLCGAGAGPKPPRKGTGTDG